MVSSRQRPSHRIRQASGPSRPVYCIEPAPQTFAEYFTSFDPAAELDLPVPAAPSRWHSAPWDDIIQEEDISDTEQLKQDTQFTVDQEQDSDQDSMKAERVCISQELLQHFENEGDGFLYRIITGDETWVHHYDPENKWQSMEYWHKESPQPKKFKTHASAGKVMLTAFWDVNGVILADFMK
jgi:hypothetical protein